MVHSLTKVVKGGVVKEEGTEAQGVGQWSGVQWSAAWIYCRFTGTFLGNTGCKGEGEGGPSCDCL